MFYSDIDIHKYILIFLDEMANGLEGSNSSLKMLPTFIEFKNKIPINEPIIVIDAGGTNLRSAIVELCR